MIKKLFGFDNEYGRPLPYVIFLIIVVSSLPMIIISSVSSGIDCEQSILFNEDGTPLSPENFKNKVHSTQEEALKECQSITENSMNLAKGISAVFFAVLLYSLILHPWINKEENPKRSTPI